MVDEDRQRSRLLRNSPDHLAQVLGLLIGQPGGGLVEQHQLRPSDDGAGDLDQPALTGPERAHRGIRIDLEPGERDRAEHVLAPRGAAQLGVLIDQRDVIEHRQLLDRLLGLERPPHPPPRAAEMDDRQQVFAERAYCPPGRPDETAQDVEERRLAGTVGADQPAGTVLEGQTHAIERGDAAEADSQAVNFDRPGPAQPAPPPDCEGPRRRLRGTRPGSTRPGSTRRRSRRPRRPRSLGT